ncbi:hypothetical protein NE237_004728 [Protea cynaroides]|uniref:Uncharacterized protein n=1 Tax=Protea cynaroides TaxID=273540 RepID=A0A9Q0KJG3_9MAGN|nr:hypothetical protein NE237_004728 [Protea cynaroides]
MQELWPEKESFSDRDLGPVPVKWKGTCIVSNNFHATSCNWKSIGARYFCNDYEFTNSKINETLEYCSPRDSMVMTLIQPASIAADRYVSLASTLGYVSGVAAGMAPLCWISV